MYSNIWTSPIIFIEGFNYCVIFVDYYTRYVWAYFIKNKFDIYNVFIRFRALAEKCFKNYIKIFYIDNGGIYLSLKSFCATNEISHLTTPPDTPKHNRFFECRRHHIIETRLTLLHHTHMSLSF